MMAEYIEREALIGAMQAYQYDTGKDGFGIMALIGVQPAANVVEVVHGRWIVTKEFNDVIDMDVVKYTCSACGEYRLSATTLSQATNYCPNCGAKMDGE